ncbi:unnamed protein product [Amoebophrya sp. A120]|nr:unnamed protein product [Amoebophrya sp. A120]|eukprot:GSA120T00016371001.1
MSSHNTTIDRRAAGIAAPPPPSRQLQEHDQGSYYFRHADKIAAGGEGDAFLDNEPELEVQEEEAPVSKKKSSCSMNKPLVITLIVLAAVVIIGVVIAVVVVMVNNSNDEVQPENDPPAMQNREDLGSLNAFLQDESNRFHEPVVLSDGQTYENKKAEKLCDVELQSLRDESGELNLEKLNRCTIGGDDHDGGQPDGPERRIALWPVDMDQIPHRSAAAAVVQHQETKVEGATASFLPRVRQHKEDHEPTAARDQHQDEDASTEKTVVKRVPKMFPNHNLQAFYTAWNDAEGHPSTHFQDSNNIPEVLLCETKHLETGFVVANSKALCRYPAIDTEGRTWNMPEVWLLTEEEQELLAKNTSPVYFMNETLQQLANAYRTFHNMAVPPTQPVPREDIPVLPLVPSPFPRPGGDGNNGGTNGAAGRACQSWEYPFWERRTYAFACSWRHYWRRFWRCFSLRNLPRMLMKR